MDALKLSVSMIVKNETSCLAACLASVQGADEIVVVDTGSTDGTPALARAHGATVFEGPEFAWRDDFAFSRNQSLDRCTGEWVLIIDADETLEPGGIAKARALMNTVAADACYCNTVAATDPRQVHRSIRLFRRAAGIRWQGRVHNYLTTATGADTDLTITYGYSAAHAADPDRALRILSAVVAADPGAKRERYYLAREHWYRRDWAAAAEHYERYLAVATWAPEMADAWLMLARCRWALGQGDAARAACLRAVQINTNFHEALIFMAELSGPKNARRWREWAATASNADVLFVRSAPERPASYYDALYAAGYATERYTAIYEALGAWAGDRSLLDVGCGTAALADHVRHYRGFDGSAVAVAQAQAQGRDVWQGDVYAAASYRPADCYALIEVLEHLARDREAIALVPAGSAVALTVPTFADPGHVRTYDEATLRARYADLIRIDGVQWFELSGGRWLPTAQPCHPGILMATGTRMETTCNC